jgi:hypothetical protein
VRFKTASSDNAYSWLSIDSSPGCSVQFKGPQAVKHGTSGLFTAVDVGTVLSNSMSDYCLYLMVIVRMKKDKPGNESSSRYVVVLRRLL